MRDEQNAIDELLSAGFSLRTIALACGESVAVIERIHAGKAKVVRGATRHVLSQLIEGQKAAALLPEILSVDRMKKAVREMYGATGLLHLRA